LRQRLGTLRNPGEAIGCERFDRPEPRVELGMALPGLASSCIDISDGVLADLRRLALGSHCGIHLQIDALPLSAAVRAALGEQAWQLALQGGEDYELAITVPPDKLEALRRAATAANTPLTVVGSVIDKAGVHCVLQGRELPVDEPGFDHFAAS
jgi:thiamine-monophosphate kinase